ncbi:22659_t:CDS:2, partial [Gigaspora rosea]
MKNSFFEGLSSMKDQGSRADHAGDKAPTYQIENEIGLTVQREKETIPSYVTIVGDWDTMLITAHQGQIDDHLKGNQVSHKKLQDIQHREETISLYDRELKAIWEDFIDFCNTHELVALPASRDSVLAYLVWSDIRGRTVKPALVLTAISNQHSGENLSDSTKAM